ncbi:phosphoserine aminotransferase [Cystoisospora suis]|uniref:Phosphoserine aminotransferase n=1 Tax=Cystoisospora suis TaxID=483139 RepID=A0A2C6KKJ4_9APIC|nr:phosphoserine aminotransferase [Cystoisospora suis]
MANSSPSPLLSSSCSPSSCTSFLENEEDFIHFKATPQQHVLPYGRAVNFSAGPACLPVEVLLQAQHDLLNWHGCGMSIMEMSHRGRFYLKMMEDTENRLTSLLEIPQTHRLLFMQGGATMQFAAQPLNMLRSLGDTADYVITGNWSEYAWKEGKKYGPMRIASDNRTGSFKSVDIPSVQEWQLNPHAAYVHYCDNETVYGLEFAEPPDLSLAQILSPEELQTLKLSQHNPAQLQATSKAASPAGLLQACADGTKKGEEKDRKEEEMKKNPISDQEKDIENYLPASSHTNGLNGRDRHSSGVPTSFFSTCPSLEESTKGVYSSTNRSAYVWNLTSDMSSNFCSRPIDFEKYALIYGEEE